MNYLDLEKRLEEQDKQIILNKIEFKTLHNSLLTITKLLGADPDAIEQSLNLEKLEILNAVKAANPELAAELATRLMGSPLSPQ